MQMMKNQDVENRQKCKFLVNVNVFAESQKSEPRKSLGFQACLKLLIVMQHQDLFQEWLEMISPPLMKSFQQRYFFKAFSRNDPTSPERSWLERNHTLHKPYNFFLVDHFFFYIFS